MKVRFKKEVELLPVEDPHAGGKYHVMWAKRGCVWNCKSIDTELGTALLVTPKTKKEITVSLADLRHTRSVQAKILKNQITKS